VPVQRIGNLSWGIHSLADGYSAWCTGASVGIDYADWGKVHDVGTVEARDGRELGQTFVPEM
jgi:hypothetical protein